MRFKSIMVATIVATGLAFSSVSTAQAAEVTEAQIAGARTPADHEAIAAAYDVQAKEAEDMAAKHQSMAKAYTSIGATGTKGGGTQAMVSHCKRLVTEYRAAAKEYQALATEHRTMAKTATK